jgi:hypothetical protein
MDCQIEALPVFVRQSFRRRKAFHLREGRYGGQDGGQAVASPESVRGVPSSVVGKAEGGSDVSDGSGGSDVFP